MKKTIYKGIGRRKIVTLCVTLVFIFGALTSAIGLHNEIIRSNTSPLPLGVDLPWWNTDWLYCKEITINQSRVDANLTNFPVLINFNSDTDLANNAQDDGDDIVFINDSNNQLNHEIEYFNNYSGDLVCWVNVTSISSTENTTIYIYYGNPTCSNQQSANDVWDSNFMMVQHLNEPCGPHYDSTSYDNNGLPKGGLNQSLVGKIDGADIFDGIDDYINCSNDFSLNISDMLSVEALVSYTETGEELWRGVVTKNDYMDWAFAVGGTEAPGKAVIYISGADGGGSGDVISTSSINDGIWHYIAATYDGSITRIYVDGIEENNSTFLTGAIHTSMLDLLIGNYETLPQIFKGGIDEVRVSNIARDDDWIKTQYNNQNDPSSFYDIGNQETFNMKPVADFTYTPENPSTEDVIQFTDTSTDSDGTIDSWFWDFDDGDTSTLQNPTHQYAEVGTYEVSLNVTDDDGATDEISKEIKISVANDPPYAPIISGDTEGKVNEELTFTVNTTDPEGDDVSYWIDWGDGTSTGWTEPSQSGVEVEETHSWSENGIYNVKAKAKDVDMAESNWGDPHTVEITNTSSPVNLKIKLKAISIGKVTAIIKNKGVESMSNISWTISVKMLRLLKSRRTVAEGDGKISIPSGEKVKVSTPKKSIRLRFGLARVKVTATVDGHTVKEIKQFVLILGRIVLARPKLLGI